MLVVVFILSCYLRHACAMWETREFQSPTHPRLRSKAEDESNWEFSAWKEIVERREEGSSVLPKMKAGTAGLKSSWKGSQ